MNLNDTKKRIQDYLRSTKAYPLVVDVQTKQDLSDLVDYFQVGNNQFPSIEQFCNADEAIKIDELYAYASKNKGNTFLTRLSGFLKLYGEETTKTALKTLVTASIAGHMVIITYQCKNYLKFSDPRIAEAGRIILVDGTPDCIADICFIDPSLEDAFPEAYQGLQKVGEIIEHCTSNIAYVATKARKSDFPNSVYHVAQLQNAYDILCERDPRTSIVPQSFGDGNQWNYALKLMGQAGNWSSVIQAHFGSEFSLSNHVPSYSHFDSQKKWLYFIALSICGAKGNEYLQLAVNNASCADDLVRSIFRAILTVNREDAQFSTLYCQRKELISHLTDYLQEITDYCKVLSVKGEDAIYYLTDADQLEKERVITWLDTYGINYNADCLADILAPVYPDLASYLSKYRFRSDLLDQYFDAYKYQKVVNHILPSFEVLVDEQSSKMGFVTELKPRAAIIDKLDTTNARAFFFDALGVEYLGFIQKKCSDYGLSAKITCARCNLPSLTSYNKEFVAALNQKGCQVSDIKDLDEIKHHGEDNFDYEKQKTPLYLIKELDIIDELLVKIRASIFGDQYQKAIIISDHGASRLAVLHETENMWSMATSGEHSGRCCRVSEIDSKPTSAVEESGFWVLTNYDRFKGGRKANVEVHGGASLEEVAVPIIEIVRKQNGIEAFIVDTSKVIMLSAKEHARVQIYVAVQSSSVSIKLDGKYYDAKPTDDAYIYSVDLLDYTKKGVYSFEILDGNEVLATNQQFEIKKKGMTESNLFD